MGVNMIVDVCKFSHINQITTTTATTKDDNDVDDDEIKSLI